MSNPTTKHNVEGDFTRTIEHARLDAEAAELRAMRLSYRAIAARQGVDVSTAHSRVKRALAAVPVEAVTELRQIEGDALDASMRALQVIAQDATVSERDRIAARRELRLCGESKRRLFGLDAPAEVRVTVSDTMTSEIERLAAELGLDDLNPARVAP
jgi:hypothetical protein